MPARFERDMDFVLTREGAPPGKDGYVHDAADPGGETKFGISQRAYPQVVIKDLTRDQAIALYRRDYWEKAGCDRLAEPLALVVFDTAVNMGVGRAVALLLAGGDWEDYLWRRLEVYRQIVQQRPASLKFLPGWLRRIELLRAAAIA